MPESPKWELSREIISGILITSCIFAAAVFIPVLGFFLTILIPLPILFYRMKLGRQAGISIGVISVGIMVVVLKALGGLSVDLLFFTALLLLGFLLSELFKKKVSIEKAIGYACVVVLCSAFVVIYGCSLSAHTGMLEFVSNYVAKNLALTIEIYKGMGISPDTLTTIEKSFDRIQYTLVRIIPSVAASMLLLIAWANLLIIKPLLQKQQLTYSEIENLNCWRAPEILIWGLIASGLTILLTDGGIRMIGVNGLIIMFTVYFFQGIAIVAFFFDRKGMPRILRIFIYTLIGLKRILILIVVGLGIFDMWLDLRKLNRMDNQDNPPG